MKFQTTHHSSPNKRKDIPRCLLRRIMQHELPIEKWLVYNKRLPIYFFSCITILFISHMSSIRVLSRM
jgi:hypothetical protein